MTMATPLEPGVPARPGDAEPDALAAPPPDPRRVAIVSDPQVRAYVRAVLRRQGVLAQDLGDKVDDVLAIALDAGESPGLPLDDRQQAKRYLGGVARNLGIHDANDRADDGEHGRLDDAQQPLVASAVDPLPDAELHLRSAARKVIAKGLEMFPDRFPWIVRRAAGESVESIARSEKLSEGYVRHELSDIVRKLRPVLVAAGIVLGVGGVVLGGFSERKHQQHREIAPPQEARRAPLPPLDAPALRDRAIHECDAFEWQACADDLDAARQLDPAGDTQQLRELRSTADGHLRRSEPPPLPPPPPPPPPPRPRAPAPAPRPHAPLK
jgi:hypothetical protein